MGHRRRTGGFGAILLAMHRHVIGLVAAGALLAGCNSGGSGSAEDAATGEAGSTVPVRVVTLNLLHGFFCPPETDSCQAPDRVAIFADLVEEADCPDLVGLQEIGPRLGELLPPTVAALCDGSYTIAWQAADSPDRALILSRLPIVEQGYLDIANFPWEAYWVRVDAPLGPVDFLTTHFASSANNPDCTADACPPICEVGISTNRCHAVEVVDFLDRRPEGAALTIVAGDLNAQPDSATVETLTGAGFQDGWVVGDRPECDPVSHAGCTGGGEAPEPFVGMDTRAGPGFDERIDYLLVRPAEACDLQIAAGGFADQPRATAVNGLYWPSDHAGVQASIGC